MDEWTEWTGDQIEGAHVLTQKLTLGPCSPLLAAGSVARRGPPYPSEWLLPMTPSQHDRRLRQVGRSSSQSPAAVVLSAQRE